jgi:hypothetical protein
MKSQFYFYGAFYQLTLLIGNHKECVPRERIPPREDGERKSDIGEE